MIQGLQKDGGIEESFESHAPVIMQFVLGEKMKSQAEKNEKAHRCANSAKYLEKRYKTLTRVIRGQGLNERVRNG
jgi:Zn/Cd-binding protein ZinT